MTYNNDENPFHAEELEHPEYNEVTFISAFNTFFSWFDGQENTNALTTLRQSTNLINSALEALAQRVIPKLTYNPNLADNDENNLKYKNRFLMALAFKLHNVIKPFSIKKKANLFAYIVFHIRELESKTNTHNPNDFSDLTNAPQICQWNTLKYLLSIDLNHEAIEDFEIINKNLNVIGLLIKPNQQQGGSNEHNPQFIKPFRKKVRHYFDEVAHIFLRTKRSRLYDEQEKLSAKIEELRPQLIEQINNFEQLDRVKRSKKLESFFTDLKRSTNKAFHAFNTKMPSEYNAGALKIAIENFLKDYHSEQNYNSLHQHLSLCIEKVYQDVMDGAPPGLIGADEYVPELKMEILCLANSALQTLDDEKINKTTGFICKIIKGLEGNIQALDDTINRETSTVQYIVDTNRKKQKISRQVRAWSAFDDLIVRKTFYKDHPILENIITIRKAFSGLDSYSKKTSKLKLKKIKAYTRDARKHVRLYYQNTKYIFNKKLSRLAPTEKTDIKNKTIEFKNKMSETFKKHKSNLNNHRVYMPIRVISKALLTLLSIVTLSGAYFAKRKYSEVTTGSPSFWRDKTRSYSKAETFQGTVQEMTFPIEINPATKTEPAAVTLAR